MAQFLVRYNVEFSRQVEADSEEKAIEIAIATDEDTWDQKSTSQYEAEEIRLCYHTQRAYQMGRSSEDM
jgi:hypothetical protein